MTAATNSSYWTTTRSGKTHYHATDQCEYLDESNTSTRSQDYIDYHDLDPCHHCAETVWVVAGGNQQNHYHTTRDCPRLTRADRQVTATTRHDSPHHEACHAPACDGDDNRHKRVDWTCDRCGDTMSKQAMAYHLRSCAGGDADA